jgi:hypothetical protein
MASGSGSAYTRTQTVAFCNFDGLKERRRLGEAGKSNQLKRLNPHLSNGHQ